MAVTESSRTRPLRVGHKGAALLAPGNTLAASDAALEAGVDMIEFDVLSERRDGSGRLLLAHDYEALRDGSPLTLEQGLAHLAGEEFAGVRARRRREDPRLRPARGAGAARGGPDRALAGERHVSSKSSTRCARWSRRCAWAGRCRAAARLHDRHAHGDPRAGDPQRLPRAAAPARPCGAARRSLRRDHGPLAPGHSRAGARGGRRRRRAVRLDGRRRRADRQAERASASTGSSPTTRVFPMRRPSDQPAEAISQVGRA